MNTRGEWVPSIPLPFYGFRFVGCGECDRTFKSLTTSTGRAEQRYREHYAYAHILGL